MKKILFCAAVAALATACTNEDDLVMNQDNSRVKGLTFDVTLAEGATTRGELWRDDDGTYPFFWYAETDRINVFAYNAEQGDGNTTGVGVVTTVDPAAGVWTLPNTGGGTVNPAVYKATQSAGAGQFTAQDDANMLLLKDYDSNDIAGTTATIVATYGDIAATTVTSKVKSNKAVPGELTELVVETAKSNATQDVDRANAVDAPMYSVSTAVKEEAYNSLGEKANLKMIRPFPVIRFTTKNTKEYISDLGKLQSVELTALGYTEDGKTIPTIVPSALAYDANKKYTVIGDKVGFAAGFAASVTPEKVTVTLQDGTWSDDDAVYMTVAPVVREAFRDKSQKEAFKVVYKFDNITFTLDPSRKDATAFEKEYQTSNDWEAVDENGNPNAITPLPALDINNYNYLVTGASNNRTLIVIKGNFKDIFKDKANVAWDGAGVGVENFTKIISNVALTNEELATLKTFKKVTELTLKENTSIPANTISGDQANIITELTLPKVTSIDEKFIADVTNARFMTLKKLIMPAYEFTNATVNKAFFENTQNTLVTIDMSGVTSMMPTFGIDRTMTFTNYKALEEVTVKDGVIVSPNGFAGCKALKKITGKLDIADASDVFKMEDATTNANNALKSVEVIGTVIPSGAFTNCKALENVVCNGGTVVPTAIGANAFEGTKVQYMDLSQAATIGAAAFKNSDITSTSKSVSTMTVGATELPASIFEGCTNLKMVKFTAATKITGADIFAGATRVTQIKFEKVISLADVATGTAATYYANVFTDTPSNIDFWTNPEQPGVDGNKLTLSFKIGTGAKTQEYGFKSIQKKLD